MPSDVPVEQLLRASACVELDAGAADAIRKACRAHNDWDRVIHQAELHGIAPSLHRSIGKAGAEVPQEYRKKLKALTLRHVDSSRIRTRALQEIQKQLDKHGIDVLVLKGAALAHLIYENPGLRPMSDIDLLVAPEKLVRASEVVSGVGYKVTEGANLLPDHHHLPTMSRNIEGLRVSIEIHHDALTRDNFGSIRLDSLSGPAREFTIDGTSMRTLGHIDMLRHLCRHALEPRESMKIGSALDIMMYTSRYADDIDWPRLAREFPEVITMLRLLGFLIPWPSRLSAYVPEPGPLAPKGVGVGLVPLSSLRHRRNRASKLLNPSDWWLRCFYNVPPGHSLAYTKTIRHPARVLFWLWRRRGKALL